MLSKEPLRVFCGTPSYMAPELAQHREYSGAKADVWAAGVVLYVLLTGGFPFKGENEAKLFKGIIAGKVPEAITCDGNEVSASASDLLSRMLMADDNVRYSAQQALEHPWFGI